MDDIGLYKGKLNEALEIIPSMTQEKKMEAVTYWNNLAMQFQKIVTNLTSADKSVPADESPSDTATTTSTTTTIGRKNAATIDEGLDDRHLITSDDCDLDKNQVTCAEPAQRKRQKQLQSISPPIATTPSLMEYIGSENTDADDDIDMLSNFLPSSKNLKSTRTASTTTSISNELVQGEIPLDPPTLTFDDVILARSLRCPRTTASMAADIGNGQFDRGPTKNSGHTLITDSSTFVIANTTERPSLHHDIDQQRHHHDHHHHQHNHSEPTLGSDLQSSALTLPSSYQLRRTDSSYTHSSRPLQQIQPYDLSNHPQDLVYQDPESNSRHTRSLVYHGDNNLGYQQHNLQFVPESPTANSNTPYHHGGSIFSSCSDTSSPLDNVSPIDLEQIVDIKRELIDESERDRANISDGASNSSDSINDGNVNNQKNQPIQHTCDVCGKSGFSTKGNLKRHLKAHSGEKPFKCDFCTSCFTEKKSLKIHVRRHTGEKPYKCDVCGKLFSQTGVLQSHMALHLNERKFECQKCGKAFRQRSQLKLHLMRHDGVKRLKCFTCEAKFLTKGDLERHCRIHTGERPYRCELCNKTFTRQQSLNEHMNRHTGRKPYYCKYCDKTFSEMSACYKHAKTHKRHEQQQKLQQQMVLQDV